MSQQKSLIGLVRLRFSGGFFGSVVLLAVVFSLTAPLAHAATIVVTNLNDSGAGSLRQAILDANASAEDDTITFSVSGTIVLSSQLPSIASASTAGKLTIDGSGQTITISGNNSVRVFSVNLGANLTLKNLTIANGSAASGGGIDNAGTVTIQNSTLSGNSANSTGGAGGAILHQVGTLTITNSTISGNSSHHAGGGIAIAGGATATITNSTISGNSAANFGGGINNSGSTVYIKNSIVANSTSGGNCSNFGTLNASGVNFATDASCSGFTQVTPAQLNLGALAVNPPGTTATHALQAGSVAIDAVTDCTLIGGGAVTTDQRGVSRPQGANCDAGAYEAQFVTTLTVTGAGTGNGTVTDTGISCTITAGSTSGDCSETVPNGTNITLTATASSGSTFAGWTNCDSPSGNQCTMTMNADKTVTATFNLTYTLGDVNDDGKINTLDARMAQQHAEGVITLTGTAFLAADVDTDSDVDSADATAIAKKGIGLPTGIPGFASLEVREQRSEERAQTTGLLTPLLLLGLAGVLALARRKKKLAMLLLAGGLSLLTGCLEFAGLAPPSGPAIYLSSISMPNGATRTLEIAVQQLTAQGGVASFQGRITYPTGVAIQSVTGLSGFVVKALSIDNGAGEVRFSLVKPSPGGVSTGVVMQLAVSASGAPGTVYTLSWAGNAQAPIVLGGDTNTEITGFSTGNGQVQIR